MHRPFGTSAPHRATQYFQASAMQSQRHPASNQLSLLGVSHPMFIAPELIEGMKRGVLVASLGLALGLPALYLYRTSALSLPDGASVDAAEASTGPGHVIGTGPGSMGGGAGTSGMAAGAGAGSVVADRAITPTQRRYADFAAEAASSDAKLVADWITDSGDNHNLSFVIIDKKNAKVFVFSPAGKLVGATPVLLGAARGDDSVPGIGQRPIAQVRPQERTTPAGRFVAEPGVNMSGEDVVWVDYDAAVSMHRVRVVDPKERRLQRLASPTAADNRISYGCVNVPVAFFENVLSPEFRSRNGVVYVLPEVKPIRQVFAAAYAASAKYAVSRTARRNDTSIRTQL
jgi:hypothetical protein